jgi:hypothetical protein
MMEHIKMTTISLGQEVPTYGAAQNVVPWKDYFSRGRGFAWTAEFSGFHSSC